MCMYLENANVSMTRIRALCPRTCNIVTLAGRACVCVCVYICERGGLNLVSSGVLTSCLLKAVDPSGSIHRNIQHSAHVTSLKPCLRRAARASSVCHASAETAVVCGCLLLNFMIASFKIPRHFPDTVDCNIINDVKVKFFPKVKQKELSCPLGGSL